MKCSLRNVINYCLLMTTVTLVACSMSDDEGGEVGEYVKVGDRLPLFSVETVQADGTTAKFSTTQLTGETVIVLFHTGCQDCQRELPRMNDYYLQHCGDKGFQMVAISREEGAESVAAYWKEQGLSIPYSAQTDRRIYNLFASSIIPRTYFCSADGTVTQILVETFF